LTKKALASCSLCRPLLLAFSNKPNDLAMARRDAQLGVVQRRPWHARIRPLRIVRGTGRKARASCTGTPSVGSDDNEQDLELYDRADRELAASVRIQKVVRRRAARQESSAGDDTLHLGLNRPWELHWLMRFKAALACCLPESQPGAESEMPASSARTASASATAAASMPIALATAHILRCDLANSAPRVEEQRLTGRRLTLKSKPFWEIEAERETRRGRRTKV